MRDQAAFGLELEAVRQLETIGNSVAGGRSFEKNQIEKGKTDTGICVFCGKDWFVDKFKTFKFF